MVKTKKIIAITAILGTCLLYAATEPARPSDGIGEAARKLDAARGRLASLRAASAPTVELHGDVVEVNGALTIAKGHARAVIGDMVLLAAEIRHDRSELFVESRGPTVINGLVRIRGNDLRLELASTELPFREQTPGEIHDVP